MIFTDEISAGVVSAAIVNHERVHAQDPEDTVALVLSEVLAELAAFPQEVDQRLPPPLRSVVQPVIVVHEQHDQLEDPKQQDQHDRELEPEANRGGTWGRVFSTGGLSGGGWRRRRYRACRRTGCRLWLCVFETGGTRSCDRGILYRNLCTLANHILGICIYQTLYQSNPGKAAWNHCQALKTKYLIFFVKSWWFFTYTSWLIGEDDLTGLDVPGGNHVPADILGLHDIVQDVVGMILSGGLFSIIFAHIVDHVFVFQTTVFHIGAHFS